MNCLKCKKDENDSRLLISCDSCNRLIHRKCSDLNASELKVMELEGKRLLKYICEECSGGLLMVPKLLKTVEELKAKMELLERNMSGSTTSHNTPGEKESIDELLERQRRCNNLMVFNMAENSNDLNDITTLLRRIVDEPINIVKVTRVGKPNKNSRKPLRIVLTNSYDVQTVLKSRSKLKGTKVFFYPDLTVSQRLLDEQARDELKRRESQGETDLRIKYTKGIPQVVAKN